MTYQDVKKAVTDRGYRWFEKELSLNLVWERTSEQITDRFTDFLHVCWMENGEQILTIPATTKAGMYGAFASPITYGGITGTAVIMPGQYPGAWQFVDSYTGFTHYPYFAQVGPMNYWRDGDKDNVIDHVQEQDQKNFSTCGHRMTNNGVKDGVIDSPGAVWSLGCMGAPEPEWRKILDLVRRSVKIYGNKFTVTLI